MLILLTVVLTALTISGWLALKEEERGTLKEIKQRGNDISRFVAKSLAYSVVGYDYHTIQLLLDEITVSEDIGYAKVVNTKGKAMGESGNIENQSGMVIFAQDIKLNEEMVGSLLVGLSTKSTISRLESQKHSLLKREAMIILLIAMGEFMALSLIIIRPVTVMSKKLSNSVDENGRVITKLPVESNDEFGQLASLFNTLGEQLNEANARLHEKVELADQELIKTNRQLLKQSEELKHISEEFRKMSITDALTGLYNRRHFETLMEDEMNLASRYGDVNSLLVLDIDRFKNINDTYGHPCGDIVLKEISSTLRNSLRKSDILCRVGGEEFVAMCRRVGKQSAIDIAEKLRSRIEGLSVKWGDEVIHTTVSIGVATSNPKNKEAGPLALYKEADEAVYYSKENGRNRVIHKDDIKAENSNIVSIERA